MSTLRLDDTSEKNILNMLIDHKVINSEQMKRIMNTSKEIGKTKLETAIELELANEDEIVKILSNSYSLPKVELKNYKLDDKLKKVIPFNYIEDNSLVPFEISNNTLKIAIPDASKLSLMKNIETITQMNAELFAASISDINNFINRIKITDSKIASKENKPYQAKKKPKTESFEDDSGVITFGDKIIQEAIDMEASDIHIENFRNLSRVRYRIDGILKAIKQHTKFLDQHYSHVIARMKTLSHLDIAEKRKPQDGSFTFKEENIEVDLRVSVLPTKWGERIVMRILNKDSGGKKLEELGFEKNDLAKIKKAITSPQGMVLVTGPTGSGKTTTLYSVLQFINKSSINILTAEDPVEFDIEGIGQVTIREDINFTFEKALRSFLRQDPEIILIGEMRDKITVETALKASLTGHLVFSTLHTNNALGSIIRLLDMETPNYLISSALTLIIAQRLVRRLCSECKIINEKITQNLKILNSIGIDSSQSSRARIYMSKGCNHCNQSGHKGRMGVYEVLEIDRDMKQAILTNKSQGELENIAKKKNFRNMQTMAHEILLSGEISYEEYERQIQTAELTLAEYDEQEDVKLTKV
jgi:type IV pilus assembly protein PilB